MALPNLYAQPKYLGPTGFTYDSNGNPYRNGTRVKMDLGPSQEEMLANPDKNYLMGGSGYDPYEGMQQGYEPVASTGGDPDVTRGTYQPTIPPEENHLIGIDPNESKAFENGGFSMQDLPQWLQDAIGSVGGSLSNYAKDPNLLAAIAGAWNSYNQAGKYGEMGKSLREEGNPFGQYRQTYGEGLMDLYKDPSSLENSAAYQARMRAGLNTLGPQLAAKGGGFGNMGGEMIKYASDLASTEYDKEWQRRFNAAGGQFGPEASIKAQLDAARLEAEARNAALDQLFTPFGKKDGTTINNNNGTGGGSYKPDSNGTIGMTGAGMQGVVSAIYAGGQGALKELSKLIDQGVKYIDLGDGTKIDVAAAARSMGGTDSPGNYGTYPTDGSIGNYGPIEPIAPDPGVVGTPDPGGFTPTAPMPDDYLYEGLNTWYEP